jgi:hypothetical protein
LAQDDVKRICCMSSISPAGYPILVSSLVLEASHCDSFSFEISSRIEISLNLSTILTNEVAFAVLVIKLTEYGLHA